MTMTGTKRIHRLVMALILAVGTAAVGQARAETRMLRMPDIGRGHIAFMYAGDIWIADRDGKDPERLTVHPAQETHPSLSPDGRWVAFTGHYDGNPDVYVVSIDGGQPTRLTYHPAADNVRGWSGDGSRVLFASARDLTYERGGALYTVSTDGGFPERLPMPYAWDGDFSGDGRWIAYQPFPSGYSGRSGWKRYRGGTTPPIWLFDLVSHKIERIPHDRVNDAHPMWLGDKVYFVSDRNGTANIFVHAPGGTVRQITRLTDWDVRWASGEGQAIVFEAAGRLHLLDLVTEKVSTLAITIAPDLPEARPHWVSAMQTVTAAGISPSGARAVFAARGDILSVPVEKGDVRNLSRSPGSHERSPLWSPDGKEIAYVSDGSGEYAMVIAPQDGLGDSRTIELGPPDHYTLLAYSPDGERIVYTHSGLTLFSIATSGQGKPVPIDTNAVLLFGPRYEVAFSPDSRWLAYTRVLPNRFRVLMLHDFASGASHQVTEGLGEVASPVFSHDGKYLYFTASTNIGPSKIPLDMTTQERPVRRGIYAAVLSSDGKTPLPPESDEEPETNDLKDGGMKKTAAEKEAAEDAGAPETRVDLERLPGRIVALPVPERDYDSLAVSKDGDLYYIEELQPGITNEPPGTDQQAIGTLRRFDMKTRKQENFLDGVAGFSISADGAKLLVFQGAGRFSVVDAGAQADGGGKKINLEAARVRVVPREEWRQIYGESWRIMRDYFWDENMHGADWQAVHDKYRPLVDHVGSREGLTTILIEMVAEVTSSHARAWGGDTVQAEGAPVGLLGADFAIENGRYRITRIYTGESWNPFLQAPLAVPGVGVQEGDYLVSVDGSPVTGEDNIYSFFEGTVGKLTVLGVNDRPAEEGAREVTVAPIADERALRRWSWVENNRRKVDEATGGRVGYVYLPNTAGAGFTYFNRFYFAQVDKDAIILDERGNGGGQAANYFIDIVTRPYLSSWVNRHGNPFTTPAGAIFGPKVMLIDQFAGSGGDYLPFTFRFVGAGPLIGTRTWGGLIGGGPLVPLMDGGALNVPYFRFLDPHDRWSVENEGVPPDIKVEQIPEEVIAGHDPQLERGIEEILKMLKDYEPPYPDQPPPAPKPAAP